MIVLLGVVAHHIHLCLQAGMSDKPQLAPYPRLCGCQQKKPDMVLAFLIGYRWQLVRSSDKPSANAHAPTGMAAPESSAASDKGSDLSYDIGPASNHHTRFQTGTAGELDRLRTALRQKDDQVVSLQSQLTNLEATRDR